MFAYRSILIASTKVHTSRFVVHISRKKMLRRTVSGERGITVTFESCHKVIIRHYGRNVSRCGLDTIAGWIAYDETPRKIMRNILPALDRTLACYLCERPTTPRRWRLVTLYQLWSRRRKWLLSSLDGALLQRGIRFGLSRESTKLSGSRISFYYAGLSPRSLRRACPEKYDPDVRSKETSPRSISTINRNFLLPRCSEYRGPGSRRSFLAG